MKRLILIMLFGLTLSACQQEQRYTQQSPEIDAARALLATSASGDFEGQREYYAADAQIFYNATEDNSGAKQMRETIKRKDDAIADLEAKLASYHEKELDSTVKDIGLDPSTGFGKALKQVYKGEVNQDSLLDFAKQEYGYEPTGVSEQAPQPVQEAVIQSDARARVEALESSSQSVVPKDASEVLQKVAESGNTKDSISIDWRLIFAPKFVLEYIIIHELCHLTVFNHSSKFWKLVDSKISNRKESQNWLKVNANYLYRIRFN